MIAGTLCQMIPVSQIEGRWIKFRVEVGDTGTCIGTIMWGEPPNRNHYKGYLWGRGDPYAQGNEPRPLASTSPYPEDVALDLASLWWERERAYEDENAETLHAWPMSDDLRREVTAP